MKKEEMFEKILSRQREIAKEWDIALNKIELCKKEGDVAAAEYWEKRSAECELLSKEYDILLSEIMKGENE